MMTSGRPAVFRHTDRAERALRRPKTGRSPSGKLVIYTRMSRSMTRKEVIRKFSGLALLPVPPPFVSSTAHENGTRAEAPVAFPAGTRVKLQPFEGAEVKLGAGPLNRQVAGRTGRLHDRKDPHETVRNPGRVCLPGLLDHLCRGVLQQRVYLRSHRRKGHLLTSRKKEKIYAI